MNIKTIKYQTEAIKRIYENSIRLLNDKKEDGGYRKILFRAPTGSGKTVMASKIIENIALTPNQNVSFVWVSKGHLAEQSKKSFEKYLGNGALRFSFLEDILDNEIKENEILFTNWEKLFSKARTDKPEKGIKKGDYTNKYMRDNEWDRNLKTFCENTKKDGRDIILIIDESHLNITPDSLKIVSEIIGPVLRIDITATPKKNESYDYGDRDGEYITLEEVKGDEMIKKEVIINADIDEEFLKENKEVDGDLLIFEKAIEKRNELLALYDKVGSKVKPLVLIQLPNASEKLSTTDKEKIDWVEKILDEKYNANYENGKLAKWLSGDKSESVETISDFNSPVEFLIFKQAIATGWDCPRSQILIKFRETKSETFEIQTVGRIMRSPEFKHYSEEALNRAYVYANLNEIKIDESAFEYIKTKIAKRKSEYENIDLFSIYLQRGEYNDLKFEYRKYFFEEFFNKIGGKYELGQEKYNLEKFKDYENEHNKINLDIENLSENIITETEIKNIDEKQDLKSDENVEVKMSDFEIEKAFLNFLKANTGEYQQARSFDKIRVAIYQTFQNYLGLGMNMEIYNSNFDKLNKSEFQKIVLANKWFFIEVIEASIKKYSENRKKSEKTIKEIENWNVPVEDFYPKNSKIGKKHKKSIMQPSYYLDKWKTEVGFIENYLEKKDSVEWWYKNGDAKNEIYFGILFKDGNTEKTFYPDFIVKYKDGKIGIFDTKKDGTANSEDTILKANALSKYIEKWNKKGKNLFGGIVIPHDNEYKQFKLNQNKNHNYKGDQDGDWKIM